jgi:hypothetical protein
MEAGGGIQRASLADALDQVLNQGAVVVGEARLRLAEIDLIYVGLNLVLGAADKVGVERGRSARTLISEEPAAVRRGTVARQLGPFLGGPRPSAEAEEASSAEDLGPPAVAAPPLTSEGATSPGALGAPESVEGGVAQLVLSLVELLRQLMERQAVRRMDGGDLTDEEVERLGLALAALDDRLRELREIFGLSEEDVNLDLGPLGRLLR